MSRSHVITLGVAVSKSSSNDEVVFLEWSVNDKLAAGEHAYISSDPAGANPIIVDNGLYVNGRKIGNGFSGTLSDPMAHLGQAAVTCYTTVPAIDVTGDARLDGSWNVQLLDWGYTLTSSALYLFIQ